LGGKGKLTDSMIDKMQNYYGIVIRSNKGNLNTMKSNILATLFHCASNDERPYHSAYCPIKVRIAGVVIKGIKPRTLKLINMGRDCLGKSLRN
jgi:hypothetical protein